MDKQTEHYLLQRVEQLINRVRQLTTQVGMHSDMIHELDKTFIHTLTKEQKERLPIDHWAVNQHRELDI